jgi:hypothetical protein
MLGLSGEENHLLLEYSPFTCWNQATRNRYLMACEILSMPWITGGRILCIEKIRAHVPFERAVMGIRFNEYMIGTQFHPEADAQGMSKHLQTEEKRKTVIENHGEEKLLSMLQQLNDPDKIAWTYSHVLPNFLSIAAN